MRLIPIARSLAALLTISALLAPAAFGAPLGPKAEGEELTPGLARLASPALRSAPPARQARELGLAASGAGSLLRAGEAVVVNVRFERGALARRGVLERAGGRVLASSGTLQTVTAAVEPGNLAALAALPGVAAVTAALAPVVHGATTAVGGAGTCEGGEVISEGLAQLGVDAARAQFGLRGSGSTVGILSDSFDTASEAPTDAQRDIEGNDLPGPAGTCSDQLGSTNVLSDFGTGSDEGRAMAQIVHDLAPHAGLAFATAFQGEISFAQNIETLAAPTVSGGAGADVIADDVSYFEEPFFQDGPIAVAIDNVTTAGVSYFTSAGNDNAFQGASEINSWETPAYRNSGACPGAIAALAGFEGSRCLDFDPTTASDGTFGITVKPGATLAVDLQWAEPWGGVSTDLDAFLLSAEGSVLTGAYDDNGATQRPVEILQWKNSSASSRTVQLVINRYSAAATTPRLKFILLRGAASATEYPDSIAEDVIGPTIYGHAGAAGAISVAAVPYNNGAQPESYSSRGPVTHYFGPVEGVGPAAALGSPEAVAKPDLAASDCGATTFFAQFFLGNWRFCGTSAAAPHAAAVAALMVQGAPAASNAEIRASLAAAARPVGSFGPDAVGAGLIDAVGALEDIGATATAADPPSAVIVSPDPDPDQTPGPGPGPGPEPDPEPEPEPDPAPVVPVPSPVPPSPVEAVPAPALATAPAPASTAVAPATSFRRKPPKLVRTRNWRARVVFRFRSNQAGTHFLCRIDRPRFGRCRARIVRRLRFGRHVIRVKARNADGLTDLTPAVYRFRVKRVR